MSICIRKINLIFILLILIPFMVACEKKDDKIEQLSSTLPVIYIETKNTIASYEIYEPATITVDAMMDMYDLTDSNAGIRLRGHSTSNFEKKPYRIKFENDQALLGLGKGPSKSWVLLADYMDQSLMRNYITYKMAKRIMRTSFVSDVTFVEVVINHVHKGVYLLAEQTHVNPYRVDIDESGVKEPDIVDTGYLLELEVDENRRLDSGVFMTDWIDVLGYTNTDIRFTWENAFTYSTSYEIAYYTIKSDAKNPLQVEFIQQSLVSLYDAVYVAKTYDSIKQVLDINSAVDMYILQLITNDYDNNFSSNFLYKDQAGKFIFGPPWDFDLTYGNHYLNRSSSSINLHHLLYELGNQAWFITLVIDRLNELDTTELSLFDYLNQEIETIQNTYEVELLRNYQLWQDTRRTDGWHIIYNHYDTYDEAVEDLVSWIEERWQFICSYLDV